MNITKTLAQLTTNPGFIESLRDLMQQTLISDSVALTETFTLKPGVNTGDKLGWIGQMPELGWAGSGCNPDYKQAAVKFDEKAWTLGEWQLPLEWCYQQFENTIAEYALRKGTDIAKIEGTELWQILIEEPIAKAVVDMFWRIIWMGDTQATTSTLTAGKDPENFKICDGLFKRIMALPTSQKTTIAANGQSTTALQKSDIVANGQAITVIENILANADSRIGDKGGKIYMTASLYNALQRCLRDKYGMSAMMDWKTLENGLKVGRFDGVDLVAVNKWDSMIAEFENDGTKLNAPHRAIYCNKEDLMVGTPESAVNADLNVFFSDKERMTFMYGTGKIGTLLGEDDLIHYAG